MNKNKEKTYDILKNKYFFMVYKVHPDMCRDWYTKTRCVKGSPIEALSEIMKNNHCDISHDSYTLMDYVEISKEEFDNWHKIQKMNESLEKQDEEFIE